MEIKRVSPQPCDKTISPAISFEVDIAHIKFQEAIIGIEGWLESDDGKILANVVEVTPEKTMTDEVSAKDSRYDSQFTEVMYNSTLIASLERKALDYIEKRRMGNKKGDIYLTLNLSVRSIVTRARISHFHEIDHTRIGLPSEVDVLSSSGERRKGKILAYGHDSQYYTNFANLWILSGDSRPVFLSVNSQTIKKDGIRIPSVDWIHDFRPRLGLGEYFIVEIPKGKVVKEAWNYVNKAEECYWQWDTKGAYVNCREVGVLLSGTMKKKFADNPIIKKWKRAIEKFEKLTSLDLHEEEIKNEEPTGEISISRPETEHILIVTKALIKYAEELLQEKS